MLTLFLKGGEQKRARLVPFSTHRSFRGAGQFGDFNLAVACEVSHVDHLRKLGVQRLECEQGVVDLDYGGCPVWSARSVSSSTCRAPFPCRSVSRSRATSMMMLRMVVAA
jgi:hypothetical protein